MILIKKFSEFNASKIFLTFFKSFNTSSVVKPQKVSKIKTVPSYIKAPTYVSSYKVYLQEIQTQFNKINTKEEIDKHKISCQLARKILDKLGELVKPGITTDYLDTVAHNLCIENDAYPSPLLYRKFPKSICTSVNNVACHGIPDLRPLEDGDIINIDITVYKNGFHGDVSHTYPVGPNVDPNALKLIQVAQKCRDEAIKLCKPGEKFSAIGKIISEIVRENKMTVIPEICGHGIGSYFHGPPEIIHAENNEIGFMKEGMAFTIEPVVCEGNPSIKILDDGWTIITEDNSRTAQFEHTILITNNGCAILTE